jgi:hypothetical protein
MILVLSPQEAMLVGAVVLGVAWGFVFVLYSPLAWVRLIFSGIAWAALSEELFGRVNDSDEGWYGVAPLLGAAVASGLATNWLRQCFGRGGATPPSVGESVTTETVTATRTGTSEREVLAEGGSGLVSARQGNESMRDELRSGFQSVSTPDHPYSRRAS